MARIVIADDEKDNFLLLKEALAQCCPEAEEVDWVQNGEELLDYLKTKPRPTLVLLDLFMPRLNGYEALVQIKEDKELADLPVLVLSLAGRGAEILKAYRLEAPYIQKPTGNMEFKHFITQFKKYWTETIQNPA